MDISGAALLWIGWIWNCRAVFSEQQLMLLPVFHFCGRYRTLLIDLPLL